MPRGVSSGLFLGSVKLTMEIAHSKEMQPMHSFLGRRGYLGPFLQSYVMTRILLRRRWARHGGTSLTQHLGGGGRWISMNLKLVLSS